MDYGERVEELLGPFSKSQVFPELLREWYATGVMEDSEAAEEECQVCGHEHIRYLFQIRNQITEHVRDQCGSVCILKFHEIGVMDGRSITHDPVRKEAVIHGIIEEHKKAMRTRDRRETAVAVLAWLEGKDDLQAPIAGMKDISGRLRDQADENGFLSPKQFSMFHWAASLAHVRIPLDAFQGVIGLRKDRAKEQLGELPDWKVAQILEAFTPAQREIVDRYKSHARD